MADTEVRDPRLRTVTVGDVVDWLNARQAEISADMEHAGGTVSVDLPNGCVTERHVPSRQYLYGRQDLLGDLALWVVSLANSTAASLASAVHASFVATAQDGRCIQLHLPSGEVERLTVSEATQRAEFAAEERAQLLLALSTARHFLSDQAQPIDGAECVAEIEVVR